MIDIYSKYDNIHKNIMFYVLIYINNYIIICIICMLSVNFCVVIENAQIHDKINTNSPILRINHELITIMMN